MNSTDKQQTDESKQIFDYLSQSRLFGQLPVNLLHKIIPLSEFNKFSPGTIILEEGAKNDRVYFLIKGEVSISSSGESIIDLQRIGDIIGEMSVINEKLCSATVIAKTDVHVFSLLSTNIGHFTELTHEELQNILYRVFAKVLTEKLLLTTEKAKQFEATNKQLVKIERRLRGFHKDLENRVLERTMELQKANLSLKDAIHSYEQSEEELGKKERTNRALLEAIPDTIFRISKDGMYLDYIPANDKTTKEQEVLGKSLEDILPIAVAQKYMTSIKRAFQLEETQFFEYQLINSNRSSEYEARIVVSEEDNVLVIVRDITSRKRSEDTRERQRHKISQTLEEMKYFQDEILYIVASPPRCKLVFDSRGDRKQNIQVSIKALVDYFNEDVLLRVHRTYIVNPKKVLIVSRKKHPDFEIWLKNVYGNSISIPVGRSYISKLRNLHPEWFVVPKRQKINF